MLSVRALWVPLKSHSSDAGIVSLEPKRELGAGGADWPTGEGLTFRSKQGHPGLGGCPEGEETRSHCNEPQSSPDLFFDVRILLGKSPAISHSEESLVRKRA